MFRIPLAAAAALAVSVTLVQPVAAGPKHCPPGYAKKGWCGDRHDRGDRRDERRAYEQGYRDGQRDAWHVGDRIDRSRYDYIDDYNRRGWRDPGDGYRYVVVDGEYFLIATATGLIVEALTR